MSEPAERAAVGATFAVVDPRGTEAVASVQRYFDELDRRFPDGFDPGDAIVADAPLFDGPAGVFLVARHDTEPVACGGVQRLGVEVAEIKRMWVAPEYHGRGLGRSLLGQLERHASAMGYRTIRLDTNSVLTEAISMYERAGYVEIERYNDNPYALRFFEKRL